MRIGIVGLPQSGKTTLFHALTGASPEVTAASYGKREANVASVKVPDPRLDKLHQLYPTAKRIYAAIEYLDFAGLAKGATQRKGFQEEFLGNLRTVDALLCVIRDFENEAVPHPDGQVNPERDLATIASEMLLADLSVLENRIARVSQEIKKTKSEQLQKELEVLNKCMMAVEAEKPLRELDFSEQEEKLIRGFQFLTSKPMLIIRNIGEASLASEAITDRRAIGQSGSKTQIEAICASVEAEIAQLPDQERKAFQEEMGVKEPALDKVIRNSYHLLGLIPFFTVGEKEVRAWTIRRGTVAQAAAGAIHSDMERGFIRAEVVDFETLKELGSLVKCKERGVLRLEGKEYTVQDGDVVTFRFNV